MLSYEQVSFFSSTLILLLSYATHSVAYERAQNKKLREPIEYIEVVGEKATWLYKKQYRLRKTSF